jgi:N6-L-threonylcarbamoyladenine synthase
MTVLGIETSCDETSAAVVRDGALLSNVIRSQVVHGQFGGVVPELASRAHLQLIVPIVEHALSSAGVHGGDLHGVAAVYGPGLIGSLLVGLSFGKAYAVGLGIPFVGVNHMQGHIVSNLLEDPRPSFPFVNLTVSGGHTQLVLVKGPLTYELLGETRDDAAGEAFDKVAKMLGIGYPGGPAVESFARYGDPAAIQFPRSFLDDPSFDFSFSGLKTSVLYYLRKEGFEPQAAHQDTVAGKSRRQFIADVCAGFQRAVVDVLAVKTLRAARAYGVRDIAVAGGVAANAELRERLREEAAANNLRVAIPALQYCTDNGAMVALAGYFRLQEGAPSELELTAVPNLQLARRPVR